MKGQARNTCQDLTGKAGLEEHDVTEAGRELRRARETSWGSPCSNIVTTTQFYSPFSSRHWSRGDNTKLPSWAFNSHMKLRPNTFWTPLSPKPAHLAHSDSELLFSSLYLTLLSFSHPHFILPHTLSTIFHRTYARSTHSQNLKEKHSSTYFHTHAHAPDI